MEKKKMNYERNVYPILRERLKQIRLEKKLTQEQVSKIIGGSKNLYNRYENGTRKISVYNIYKLANYYGVTIDYLIGRNEK